MTASLVDVSEAEVAAVEDELRALQDEVAALREVVRRQAAGLEAVVDLAGGMATSARSGRPVSAARFLNAVQLLGSTAGDALETA